jgi:hypothetical protein
VLAGDGHELLAEVAKPAEEARRLGVPAGRYLVGRRTGTAFLATRVEVAAGREVVVEEAALRPEPLQLAALKGSDLEAANVIAGSYALAGGALGSLVPSNELAVGYRRALGGGFHLAPRLAFGIAEMRVRGLAYRYRALLLDTALLRRFDLGTVALLLGAGAGAGLSQQELLSGESYRGVVFRYGASAGLDLAIYRGLLLALGWDLGAVVLRLNGQLEQRLTLKASLGVGYAF